MLMQRIIDYAASRGICEIFGDVLAENGNMLDLCRHLGFQISAIGSAGVLRVSLVLLRRASVANIETWPASPSQQKHP